MLELRRIDAALGIRLSVDGAVNLGVVAAAGAVAAAAAAADAVGTPPAAGAQVPVLDVLCDMASLISTC